MDSALEVSPKRYSLVAFFLLAFVIAWGLWIPSALALEGVISFPLSPVLAGVLGAWGPSVAGILVTAASDGRQGLRALFKRLSVWRVGIQWYLFVLLWPAVLSMLVTGGSMLLGRPAPDFSHPPVMDAYPVPPGALAAGFLPLLPLVILTQFFGSSMGGEFGWRGFALPRLQTQRRALLASIILGIVWGLWHLPRYWTPGSALDVVGFGWVMLGLLLDTVVYTWVFNSTRGSLLLVVLLHTSQPVTTLFLSAASNPLLANGLKLLLVAVIVTVTGAARLSRGKTPQA